jgi:hypothetical protein
LINGAEGVEGVAFVEFICVFPGGEPDGEEFGVGGDVALRYHVFDWGGDFFRLDGV